MLIGLLAFGTLRDNDPAVGDERVLSLTERVACPTCQGESVADSRAPAAEQIRTRIDELVDEGVLTDSEILQELELAYGSRTLLDPQGDRIRRAGVDPPGGCARGGRGGAGGDVRALATRGGGAGRRRPATTATSSPPLSTTRPS